jgi:hypothetical protein
VKAKISPDEPEWRNGKTHKTKSMIIKVISYFDIQGVSQENLPQFVAELTEMVYKSIRKDKFDSIQFSQSMKKVKDFRDVSLKVISKKAALENLRTSS